MTTVDPAATYPSYSHPLVSWGSIILGAVAAVALGILLNLLVALFDAAASLHEIKAQGVAGDNALLLGVFGGLANLIALFTGGFIAARSANHPDHHDGMLHGLGVWAVSFVVAFAVLGTGATRVVGTALEPGPAAASPGSFVAAVGAASQAAATAPSEPTAGQKQAAQADAQAETQAEAHELAQAAAQTAFFGFAAMLVGLVAALVGGIMGARHPEHFTARPRRIVVVG